MIDVYNNLQTPKVSAGTIITSNAVKQSIEQFFVLNKGFKVALNPGYFRTCSNNKVLETNVDFWLLNKKQLFFSTAGTLSDYKSGYSLETGGQIGCTYESSINKFNISAVDCNMYLKADESIFIEEANVYANNGLVVGASSYKDIAKGVIHATNRCEALYFNAISDRRAKSNITPAEFSALDIIKQLPIYTFNYLNDPKLSVGLIAQEAAEHNLDGFNMVDNLEASGEFGDYMQMKESKLVYVLWKAVQELSAEVEELKAEIRNLK
jgi:hypothetical protein